MYKIMTQAYHETLASLYERYGNVNYINMVCLHPTGGIWCFKIAEGDSRGFFSVNIHGEVKFDRHEKLVLQFVK
jgi:hypothetical protein